VSVSGGSLAPDAMWPAVSTSRRCRRSVSGSPLRVVVGLLAFAHGLPAWAQSSACVSDARVVSDCPVSCAAECAAVPARAPQSVYEACARLARMPAQPRKDQPTCREQLAAGQSIRPPPPPISKPFPVDCDTLLPKESAAKEEIAIPGLESTGKRPDCFKQTEHLQCRVARMSRMVTDLETRFRPVIDARYSEAELESICRFSASTMSTHYAEAGKIDAQKGNIDAESKDMEKCIADTKQWLETLRPTPGASELLTRLSNEQRMKNDKIFSAMKEQVDQLRKLVTGINREADAVRVVYQFWQFNCTTRAR
jgi:hypothetical protein